MEIKINNKQPEGFQPFSINVKFETLEDVVKFLAHLNVSDADVSKATGTLEPELREVSIKGGYCWSELGGKIENHVLKMLK